MFQTFEWSVTNDGATVGNKEMSRIAGIESELASKADHRVLPWLGNGENGRVVYGQNSVDYGSKRRVGT